MIGFLRGRPLFVDGDQLTLDVQGVGYLLLCSLNSLTDVEGQEEVQLWVHTHVREDAIHLFGFSSTLERQVFLSLIKVNGVGPKMALNILSAAPLSRLVEMIESADTKGLSALPKVGKKTAEQMILSLRGKLVLGEGGAQAEKLKPLAAREEIVSALVNLGFRPHEVEKVVDSMDPSFDLQAGVREGLRSLTQQL